MKNSSYSIPIFEIIESRRKWLSFDDLRVGDLIKIRRKEDFWGLKPISYDPEARITEITGVSLTLDNGRKYQINNISRAVVYRQESKVVEVL